MARTTFVHSLLLTTLVLFHTRRSSLWNIKGLTSATRRITIIHRDSGVIDGDLGKMHHLSYQHPPSTVGITVWIWTSWSRISCLGVWRVFSTETLRISNDNRAREERRASVDDIHKRLLPNCVLFQCRSCINRSPGHLAEKVCWAGPWLFHINRSWTHQPSASPLFDIHWNRESPIERSKRICLWAPSIAI